MAQEAIELIKKTENDAVIIVSKAEENAKKIISDAENLWENNKAREIEIQKKAYDEAILNAKEKAVKISEINKNNALSEAEILKKELLSKKTQAIKIVIDHILNG